MNFKIMPASHDDISEIISIDKKTFMEMVDTDWYSNDCVNPKFLNFLMDGLEFQKVELFKDLICSLR